MEITIGCILVFIYVTATVEAAHRLAISKNLDPEIWRVWAFALGIFPLIALMFVPKSDTPPVSMASQTGI